MALSDCAKCWETPCRCGYEYLTYDKKYYVEVRDLMIDLIEFKNLQGGEGKDAVVSYSMKEIADSQWEDFKKFRREKRK